MTPESAEMVLAKVACAEAAEAYVFAKAAYEDANKACAKACAAYAKAKENDDSAADSQQHRGKR